MNPNDLDPADEQLAGLLEALEANLAGGGLPDTEAEPDLPPDQLRIYRLARESLLQMGQAWPRTEPGGGTDGPTFDWLTGTGQLGKYQSKRELGRGGGGIVFLATDTSAGRDVALKLPRLEALLDPELRQYFLREAQLTIGLDHANLVPVYEAGEVGAICYLASAYAGETTLADWLERQAEPVPVRTAAGLVAALADGVQYLHGHHVLHRDIKPSNVLVQQDVGGADLTPRLTDFGLAKLLDVAAPGATQTGTMTGAVLGTAEYMAPEQADARPELLGPATDVYALGAVLYELLAGRPPFRGRNKQDTLRLVLTEEPARPTRLRPEVPRDLEAVCLKCLEKEPHRRYATARELADDLRRHLDGQPTAARPLSRWRRLTRWARRRPAVAGMAALGLAAVLALVGGIVGTALGLVRAEARRVEAEEATTQALERLQQIKKGNAILASVFTDLDPREEEKEGKSLREILGERLTKAAEQLEGEAVGDSLAVAGLQNTLGLALVNLGLTERAIPLFTKARATQAEKLGPDHPDTLKSMNNLAYGYTSAGQGNLALPLFEETLKLRRAKFGADHPDTLMSMGNLASAYSDAGKLDLALPLFEETFNLQKANLGTDHLNTLITKNNLAYGYLLTGQVDRALPMFLETLPLLKSKLGIDHPDTLMCMNNLALGYKTAGKLEQALPLFEETLKLRKTKLGSNHPDTLNSVNNLAVGYQVAGKPSQAVPLFEETLKWQQAKQGADHPDTLACMNNLAEGYRGLGKLDLALPLLEKALKLHKAKLGADHPRTLTTMNNLAGGYRDAGKLDLALPLFQEAAADIEKRQFRQDDGGVIVTNLARCHERLRQFDQAEAWRRKWLAVVKERAGTDSLPYASELAALGINLLQQEKWTDAELVLRECLGLFAERQPDVWTTFFTQSLLGRAFLGQQKYAQAEPLLVQGYEGMKQRAAKIPPLGKPRLTEALERLVQLYDAWGKPDEAAPWRKELDDRKKADEKPLRKP